MFRLGGCVLRKLLYNKEMKPLSQAVFEIGSREYYAHKRLISLVYSVELVAVIRNGLQVDR